MDWLESAGPYTAPLCAFMVIFGGAVLKWLLADRERLLTALKESSLDAAALRDKRTDDANEAAAEFREHGKAMAAVLDAWKSRVDVVLARVEGNPG